MHSSCLDCCCRKAKPIPQSVFEVSKPLFRYASFQWARKTTVITQPSTGNPHEELICGLSRQSVSKRARVLLPFSASPAKFFRRDDTHFVLETENSIYVQQMTRELPERGNRIALLLKRSQELATSSGKRRNVMTVTEHLHSIEGIKEGHSGGPLPRMSRGRATLMKNWIVRIIGHFRLGRTENFFGGLGKSSEKG